VVRAKWLKEKVQLRRIEPSFETSSCWDMSLGAEELNSVDSWRIMGKKELGGAKKSSCVIRSDRLL
jgi:hypothetical protein